MLAGEVPARSARAAIDVDHLHGLSRRTAGSPGQSGRFAALLTLREEVIAPILAGVRGP